MLEAETYETGTEKTYLRLADALPPSLQRPAGASWPSHPGCRPSQPHRRHRTWVAEALPHRPAGCTSCAGAAAGLPGPVGPAAGDEAGGGG